MKRPTVQNKRVAVLQTAFLDRKVFGTSSRSLGLLAGVGDALFSKVAGSKYTCKRLRVYEATKKCV